ncbi:putative ABC transporter substrate-binding protein [Candidatus Sulfopaludibacter sp. SbA4]|nr:putative ABC transporter substrate-binding protein [Candidatus Sulfopaludibacter sp. SbA4]
MTWVLAPVLLALTSMPPGNAAIVVAYESGVDAYAEALEGMGSALGSSNIRVVDLQTAGADLTRAVSARDVQLVIAVGSRALGEVQSRKLAVPTIATMVLHGGENDALAQVDLDIPLSAQLQAIRSLWPNHLRAGIIRNPARSRYSAEALEARARKEGFTVVVVDCDGPARLLKAVASLKGKVDFLLCFPDPDLYNPVTIKPLVMASIEGRLPIVGFSPAFVRAGAAAGIYPDYRETGRQTAEMAQRMLRGEDRGAEEGPRKIRLALNQRVARLLGVEFHPGGLPVEVFR